MTTATDLTVTRLEAAWQVDRPDGYRLVFAAPDASRPGVWKAQTTAYAHGAFVTTETIDLLNSRERERFHVNASSVNGYTPIMWDRFLELACAAVQAACASAPPAVAWPALQPLHPLLPVVPSLPVTMLPTALQALAGDIAERMQVPLEYVAIPLILSAGALIGRQCGLLPKRHDDWLVIPNLWGAIIGRPGLMKSPSLAQALKPLERLAAQAIDAAQAQATALVTQRDILDAQLAGAKDALKKAAKNSKVDDIDRHAATIQGLQAQLDALAITVRRFKTNDATIQRLGELLRDNPNGMLLYRDELSGWLSSLRQDGREGDREFFLEAWNGDGAYTFDRIGRGMVHVEGLCLSILGGIQPGKLTKYVYDSCEGGAGDDGLLQRFQLLVWPAHEAAFVNVDRSPDTQARQRVYGLYERLADLDALGVGATVEDYQPLPALRFSADAQALFDAWRVALETRVRAEGLQSPAFEAHLAKYRSLMPSLALIFHLIEEVTHTTGATAVSLEAAQLAAAWCEFLEAHARKVYAGVLQKDLQAAHALADKIRGGMLAHEMTVREVYRNGWALLTTADDVYGGLRCLERYGWLQITEVTTAQGGRPKEPIMFHPNLLATLV
jgi:Protein of unknown function (DUF3987)